MIFWKISLNILHKYPCNTNQPQTTPKEKFMGAEIKTIGGINVQHLLRTVLQARIRISIQ